MDLVVEWLLTPLHYGNVVVVVVVSLLQEAVVVVLSPHVSKDTYLFRHYYREVLSY